jgi:hypothetical protein
MEISDRPISRDSSRQDGPRARVNKVAEQSRARPRREILGGVVSIDTRSLVKKKKEKKRGGGFCGMCLHLG